MLTRWGQKNASWIDLVAPTSAEVRSLMHEFGIDPLIAEELLVPSFKPKVERRGDIIYVILHFPIMRGASERQEQEIDFIIGKNFLITTRYETIDPLHAFAQAFEVSTVLGKPMSHTHGGHLFTALARSLYEALINESQTIRRRLQDTEDRIFKGAERQMVIELSQIGRVIHDFRDALAPHKEMLTSMEPVTSRLFGPEFSYYLRDLIGLEERVERTLDNLQSSMVELRETNNSLLSTKQNEVMKTLTVLAFLFLPLSFIAGVFGMNTMNNPIVGSAYDFWIIVSGMVVLAIGCFLYFKHKEWL
ncbi:MAG TPA: CorA family divalent cation transporter [Candidatus Paceibacterota bacterium]|nr:CorA family divalent cation transporter [Candidatus Paceibacterota bacterium]